MARVINFEGRKITVPDDATDDEIAQIIDGGQAEVKTTAKTDRLPMSTSARLKDAGESLASGLRTGVEGMVGGIGTANEMTGKAAGWVAGKLGASPETSAAISGVVRRAGPTGMLPSTDEVAAGTDAIANAVPGGETIQAVTRHAPQTVAGEYARTIGEFAPAAVGGPGGLIRKGAMAVVPAVMSETAGQLTKGTAAEPYARLAGGLVGGGATAGRNPNAVREAAGIAPTGEQLKQQTDALYSTLREAGIKYDADAYAHTVQGMAEDLHKAGLRPSIAKEAHAVVNELTDSIGHSPDFDDINGLISSLGQKARDLRANRQSQEALAIDKVRDRLMDFEAKAPMASRVPLPRAEFDTLRKTARDTARRNIQARTLDEVAQDADAYAAGQEAGLRNGVRNLVRSKRGKAMFNESERQALLNVANGRKPLQTLSRFGLDLTKISGNATFLPTIGATAMGGAFGLPAAGALAAAGTAAKILSPRMTSAAFQRASAAIRSGALRDGTVMPSVKAKWLQKVVRTFLTTDAAVQSSIGNSDSVGVPRQPLELTVHPQNQ